MNSFVSRLVRKNAVFALGLGIPIVFFGSTTPVTATVVAVAALYILFATHATMYVLERNIAKSLRFPVLLLVAAFHETLFELVLQIIVPFPGSRLILFVRMVALDAMLFYPFQRRRFDETFADRMKIVVILTVGFILALLVFTLIRFLLGAGQFNLAASSAVGFFILGYGKALYRSLEGRAR